MVGLLLTASVVATAIKEKRYTGDIMSWVEHVRLYTQWWWYNKWLSFRTWIVKYQWVKHFLYCSLFAISIRNLSVPILNYFNFLWNRIYPNLIPYSISWLYCILQLIYHKRNKKVLWFSSHFSVQQILQQNVLNSQSEAFLLQCFVVERWNVILFSLIQHDVRRWGLLE